MPTGIKLTSEVKNDVVNYYKNNVVKISECAIKFGLSDPTIIKILDEAGVERHKRAKINNPNMREDYFEVIDTELKAYFLGLIITDGNVYIDDSVANRQASISITQAEKDVEILKIFLDELNSNTRVGHDGRGACQAAIRSNIMANDLEKYGVVPNKTLISYLPKIDDEFMRPLLLGVLDGDGSITSTFTAQKKHKHAISFCGSHTLMCDISEYISNKLDVNAVRVYDYSDRHLSEVKWQSIHDVNIIGDWLYTGATIYLQRKREIFLNFKSHYNLQ